jgi:hypothetical protein
MRVLRTFVRRHLLKFVREFHHVLATKRPSLLRAKHTTFGLENVLAKPYNDTP